MVQMSEGAFCALKHLAMHPHNSCILSERTLSSSRAHPCERSRDLSESAQELDVSLPKLNGTIIQSTLWDWKKDE